MDFSPKRAARSLTLSYAAMKQVSNFEPLVPVQARCAAASFSSPMSEAELLEFYAEDFFINGEAIDEDEAEANDQAVAPAASNVVVAGPVYTVQSRFITHELEVVPAPVSDEQQACRPYPAATTIFFDHAAPEETTEELALYSIFDPTDLSALFMRPVERVVQHTPTPDLLDTSDLCVRPTITTGPLCDRVSQMLDLDHYNTDQVQETASVYVSKQGRSLMRSPPVCSDSFDEQSDVVDCAVDDQSLALKRRDLTFIDVDNSPRDWEIDYDRVLRRITGQNFLPGLDHLSCIQARSTFITYDKDAQASRSTAAPVPAQPVQFPPQAPAHISDACRTGTCTCLVYKGPVAAGKATGSGSLVQQSAAPSLLDLIDDIVHDKLFVDNNVPATANAFQPRQKSLPMLIKPCPLLISRSPRILTTCFLNLPQTLSPTFRTTPIVRRPLPPTMSQRCLTTTPTRHQYLKHLRYTTSTLTPSSTLASLLPINS
jgi:hypothetical protein